MPNKLIQTWMCYLVLFRVSRSREVSSQWTTPTKFIRSKPWSSLKLTTQRLPWSETSNHPIFRCCFCWLRFREGTQFYGGLVHKLLGTLGFALGNTWAASPVGGSPWYMNAVCRDFWTINSINPPVFHGSCHVRVLLPLLTFRINVSANTPFRLETNPCLCKEWNDKISGSKPGDVEEEFRHDESSCEYRLNTELVAWSTCPYYPLQLLLHLCFLPVLCDSFSHIIISTWNWPSIYKWLATNSIHRKIVVEPNTYLEDHPS